MDQMGDMVGTNGDEQVSFNKVKTVWPYPVYFLPQPLRRILTGHLLCDVASTDLLNAEH